MTFAVSSQVDKLEECEAARLEEKKEEEYKPVVMGKFFIFCSAFCKTKTIRGPNPIEEERRKLCLGMGVNWLFGHFLEDHSQLIPKSRHVLSPGHRLMGSFYFWQQKHDIYALMYSNRSESNSIFSSLLQKPNQH